MNPPTSQSVDARKALIRAGLEVFGEQGFDGARVDQIAQRAGVNKALINYHFGGKAQLLMVIIEEAGRAFFDRIQSSIDPDAEPREQLRSFIRSAGTIIAEFPAFPRLLLVEAVTNLKLIKEPPKYTRKVIELLAGVIRKGIGMGVFRPMNPLFAHIHLMSSFAMFQITAPLRENMREFIPFPPDTFSNEAFLSFVEEQILAGFAAPQA